MYQIILIARIVDGTANASRARARATFALCYINISVTAKQKITSFGANCLDIYICTIYTVRLHNVELFDRKILVYR